METTYSPSFGITFVAKCSNNIIKQRRLNVKKAILCLNITSLSKTSINKLANHTLCRVVVFRGETEGKPRGNPFDIFLSDHSLRPIIYVLILSQLTQHINQKVRITHFTLSFVLYLCFGTFKFESISF